MRRQTSQEIDWANRLLNNRVPGGDASPAPSPGQAVAFGTAYYPGTPDSEAASPIAVKAGEERSGIELSLPLQPTARLEGRIVDQNGEAAVDAQVSVVSHNPVSNALIRLPPTGRFSILALLPGKYSVVARSPLRQQGSGDARLQWARADVAVNGNDVIGVTVTLQPAVTLKGQVEIAEAGLLP